MFRYAITAVLALLTYAPQAPAEESVPAFPGAEGAGALSKGGRGGDVYHVTSLEDSGPGSLREGIVSATGARTIVFDLSGTIHLKKELVIEESQLTIAGQTAPGDGITLAGNTLKMKKASDIIVRYLRVRLGDRNKEVGGADGMTIDYCERIILDHISASWAIDGTQDERGCKDYTMQWCILSEALNHSLHEKGAHAMCASFRQPLSNISVHHNLFATSRDRHPTLGGGSAAPQWVIDFRNNVVYNWTGTANVCDNQVNIVNNYFRPGPETDPAALPIAMKSELPLAAHGHMSGNVFEGRKDLTAHNYAALDFKRWIAAPGTKYRYDGNADTWRVGQPFETGCALPRTQSAEKALKLVLAHAGASLKRDAVDERVMRDVKAHSGRVIDSQEEVGGWPELKSAPAPLDSDGDGMPDAWERKRHLDPDNPKDGALEADGNGYTNLEVYLNSLVPGK
jgi:pectate lyase